MKAVTPIPFVRARFFDRCGKPLAGGKVYTYEANTTTPKITYKDPYGLAPNTNPVVLDAAGEADIYLNGVYRIIIKTAKDVVVNDVDKLGSWYSSDLQETLDSISGAMDAAIQQPLQDLQDAIDVAAAAGAGANGWTDLVVQSWSGRTQREKNKDFINADDYGAIGDGSYHPLSDRYASLALAQADYPMLTASGRLTSLTQSIDYAAIQECLLTNQETQLLAKRYVVTDTLIIPDSHTLIGKGLDYFDFWRANDVQLLRSDSKGTHIYLYGTGAKNQSIVGLANNHTPRTISGLVCKFSKFTNEDAVGVTAATPRLFSVGIIASKNTQIKDLRVIPNYNGITGYNDKVSTSMGDEWDVGIWMYGANDARIENVQSVGYYRMAGILITEEKGISDYRRNPERLALNNVSACGLRGLLVRNSPQYEVTSNTSNTVTVKWNSTQQYTASNGFTISGSSQLYTFTGSTYDSGTQTITLTGVSPAIVGTISTIRSPNQGNNFSNTSFTNCFFDGMCHPAPTFDIDQFDGVLPAASEYDGYPMRNLVHINTTSQATYKTPINTLWGNAYNFKYIGCKHEGGYKIAYSNSETQLHTMDLRFVAQDNMSDPIAHKFALPYFNPRSIYLDSYMFPNQFGSNNTTDFKHLDNRPFRFQRNDGTSIIEQQSDENVYIKNETGSCYTRVGNVASGRWDAGFTSFASITDTATSTTVMQFYPTALYLNKTTHCATNLIFDATNSACRPATTGTGMLGTSTAIWGATYAAKYMFTSTLGMFSGSGSPEGVLTAGIGSTYHRTDGGAGTSFYVKESGTGSSGWVAK